MAQLSKTQLLERILSALSEAGWSASPLEKNHPFLIRAASPAGDFVEFRVFIWNCTHGGGSRRAKDEFRIQFTGKMPRRFPGVPTALLGWHDGYEVFAAWDIRKHDQQTSKSPSAQIKEDALSRAHAEAFATHTRDNDEVAVAFRPEFLIDYVLSSISIHSGGQAKRDFALLDRVPDLTEADIAKVSNSERRWIIGTIARRYRASDFSRRVLAAYDHRCAVCGIQLRLVEAAHINPVTEKGSTDETSNGIALCKLHHAAYDSTLISIDETYKVEISVSKTQELKDLNRHGGLAIFRESLKPAILLPADRRDYPKSDYLRRGRTARKWQS
jgi:putative restriction endonuclease